jgi:Tol biopolymer transport system component/tetratricopeptide (TPR) repeat protein
MRSRLVILFYLAFFVVFPLRAQNEEAQAFFEEGFHLFWIVGDTRGSIEQFTLAIELDPTFAEAFAYRAYTSRILTYRQENESVVADYEQAIALNPEGVMGYVARSRYQYDLGNVDAAMSDIEFALSLDPNDPVVRYNYAVYLYTTADPETVLAELEKITVIYPPIVGFRGSIYYSLGMLDEAITDFSSAIAQRPTVSDYYARRGLAYLGYAERFDPIDENYLNLAMADYTEALRLDPENIYAFNDIGVIYMHCGDYVTALDYYDYALSLAPDYETAQINGNNVRERAAEQAAQGVVSQFEIPDADAPPSLPVALPSALPNISSVVSTPTAPPTVVASASSTGIPQNGLILFTSTRDAYTEIYVMNIDGSYPTRLTNNMAYDHRPVWSPDGRQIVFSTDRDRNFEIYVMDADGRNPRNLTNHPQTDFNPTWSPDGRQIVFVSNRDGNYELYIMNVDGSNLRRITNTDVPEYKPAWSPDGTRIAYVSDYRVYVMNIDGSNQIQFLPGDTVQDAPAWSPDGTQIALLHGRKIHIVNADGTGLRELTSNTGDANNYENDPAWSPDGTQIVFTYNQGFDGEIHVVSAQGGRSRNLTNNIKADAEASWQPVFDTAAPVIQPTSTPVIPTSTPTPSQGIIFEDSVSGAPAIDSFNCTFYDTSYELPPLLAGDIIEASLICNLATSCSVFIQSSTHGFGPPPVQSRRWIGGGETISYVVPEDGDYIIGVEGYTDLDMRQEYCLDPWLDLEVKVWRD